MLKFKPKNLTIFAYLILIFLLCVYSFASVDLNLTLSANPLYQTLQNALLHLGYYQRPTSTLIFLFLVFGLFTCQLFFIKFVVRKTIFLSTLFKLALLTSAVLLFSYPAFSYDLFNYIFDARLVVTHQVNPWQYTALDFPSDLWTRFMHWTHRTYPYGPAWILLTLPFYLLGFGKFTLTLLLFKSIGAISYLACCWLIYKILEKQSPANRLLGLTVFAFNPLVIIESLVSAHLDIVMAALLLLAIYLQSGKRKLLGWLALFLSGMVKYLSLAVLPAWLWWGKHQNQFSGFIIISVFLLTSSTLVLMILKEPLPWYLLMPLAISALVPAKKLTALGIGVSIALLLRYAPFIYFGEYSAQMIFTRNLVTVVAPFVFIIVVFLLKDWE